MISKRSMKNENIHLTENCKFKNFLNMPLVFNIRAKKELKDIGKQKILFLLKSVIRIQSEDLILKSMCLINYDV